MPRRSGPALVLVAALAPAVACHAPPGDPVTTPAAPVAAAPATPIPARPVAASPGAAAPAAPPVARTVDVIDHAFGLAVSDPYRWMEGRDNTELTAWLRAQGAYARRVLDAIPGGAALAARIHALGLGVTAIYDVQLAGGRRFHGVLAAGDQLGKLAVQEPDGTDRILVDPGSPAFAAAAHLPPDTHASLHAYAPSPDGTLVAYVVSTGGGEVGVLHVMDVATGQDLPDRIERIWGEGSASWLPDGKRFFYTQLAVPRPGVDPMEGQIARLHVLGQPASRDVTILGRGPGASLPLAPEEWPGLWVAPGTRWVLALVGGAHSEQRVAVAPLAALDLSGAGKTPWRTVADYADGVEVAIPHGARLYLQTYQDAPNRRIVSVPLAHPDLAKARVEIAEAPDATIAGVAAARDALYLVRQRDGKTTVLRWPWRGAATPLPLPYAGWAHDLATDLRRDGIVFQIETWTRPGTYFAYDPRARRLAPAHLASTSTADFSNVVVDDLEATSADGTKVPLTVMHERGLALDGSHPAILYGYGGYGVSEMSGFRSTRLAWLERGGVYAIAHVRGGGERGRRWQDAGSREHKLAGVRDFIACGEALVAHHYTAPGKLAAVGASMGGVLVGRAITERPDLFAAANLAVGIVNPLRILAAQNGANQKAELGDPATKDGYTSILAMDPYQHVRPGVAYPAVIFTIGLNDHRVAPWMSAKMAARLLASTTSGRPILVRVDDDAGHGIGSTRDQGLATLADVESFFGDGLK